MPRDFGSGPSRCNLQKKCQWLVSCLLSAEYVISLNIFAACFGESARPYPEGFLGSIWLRDGLEPQNLEKKMPENLQCHSESECLRFGHFCQCNSAEASAVGMKLLFGCQNLSPGRMGVQADLAAASLACRISLGLSQQQGSISHCCWFTS